MVKPRNPVEFLLMVWRLCFGHMEQARDLDTFRLSEAEIGARTSRLPVALDGEVRILHTPLKYRARPARPSRHRRRDGARLAPGDREIGYAVRMFPPPRRSDGKRKLIEFRPEIWQALVLLARDSGKSLEALADEAFTDLLRKYRRPLSLKEALKESARRLPANDDLPQDKRERS